MARAVALLLLPAPVAAQELDVARRAYTFLDDRLIVRVETETPGALRVVRGEAGVLEVAGQADFGFVGFGLGGEITRELRLTAVGSDRVQYLVVVPERVRLTVRLPGKGGELSPTQASGIFQWGSEATPAADISDLLPTKGGLFTLHTSQWAPPWIDVPDLSAVRSLSVRFEGDVFRIAASRPLRVNAGTFRAGIELSIAGEPTDVVVYVPRGAASFSVRGAGQRLISSAGGQATTGCSQVSVQEPTVHQRWFTVYPQNGRLSCR